MSIYTHITLHTNSYINIVTNVTLKIYYITSDVKKEFKKQNFFFLIFFYNLQA